ncbi:Luminescence regulatory protein LuxO [Thiorhodovibrio winogradskyi]|uniref:Luminescence regulatory protein LuxO n=1 Tax=Thiorhodovibrio winogradskyi TaxID=77007 RepID=A0ABZ0SAQ3_9GAMM|nr:sigma 54-interacting transcriptional regulator [Thiorhodovibrio winogradskyi]
MTPTATLSRFIAGQRKPLMVVDAECQIRFINQAFEHAFGLSPDTIVGQDSCSLDAVPQLECRHRRFFRDLEPYAENHVIKLASGANQFTQIFGFPILDEDGRIYLGENLRPLGPALPDVKILGQSPATQSLLAELERAAKTEAPVLLHGETGSGKELAAEHLHRQSRRTSGPFIVVDCTVLSEDLFESELFGHIKGAFTSAVANKTGLFELADGGTLFLDEIGELPLSQQPKLLRALETGLFRQVGGTKSLKADVRVVSATHQDLAAMARQGRFRQDLFYRLAVLPIEIPPLRERREDIPELVQFLLKEMNRGGLGLPRLSKAAIRKLLQYDYPGNIRELRNIIQLAVALNPSGEITEESIRLPQAPNSVAARTLKEYSEQDKFVQAAETAATFEHLSPIESAEARYIIDLLQRHHGNRKEVAAGLSVSERTLYRKLKRYRLNVPNQNIPNQHPSP